ncbi:hypothetical protein DM860_003979 [Cuscuta australis]|uniref:Uncharacterized protein n=1 Tax=Cuscuta australis TaxID=267555 RepID=A0A328CUY1_9ASTE|nr:hypothetical protein DM860_003979 [Cuscuta australis]
MGTTSRTTQGTRGPSPEPVPAEEPSVNRPDSDLEEISEIEFYTYLGKRKRSSNPFMEGTS